jgi:hypothetical protein
MKLYKLTDRNGRTHNNTQWGEGITHSGTGEGELCGSGWIHAYTDPALAVLLNSNHANFKSPRLWVAEGDVVKNDHGLKVGCRTLTTLYEIPLPDITAEQRVRFAILCARSVYHKNDDWTAWADAWLRGDNRDGAVAVEAARAARVAARAAWAAWAAWAAEVEVEAAAEKAAWAAARAAESEDIDLITIAAEACEVVEAASWAAARAAWAEDIDLIAIAKEACAK